MKMQKACSFQSRLREDLKAPEFRAHFEEERRALQLSIKIAKIREKEGLI